MPAKTTSKTNKVKTKSPDKKSIEKMDVVKIRALEEQLAQREAELGVINSIQTALVSKLDFQGIIDAVGDKLGEIFEDGNVGIGFLDKARNVVKFPYVVENGKRIENFEISLDQPSVLSHTLKRRRPFVLNTKLRKRFGTGTFNFPGLDQRDLKSWLSVPIFHKDEIIGGISLRSWQRENAYSESTVRLLQTIANSMSVALENVRLFDETQRLLNETDQRATELQIINNIGQTLTEGLDLQSTLERVGDRLRETLNVDSIGIAAFDPKNDQVIAQYLFHQGKRLTPDQTSTKISKFAIRFAARWAGRSWVVNTDADKYYRKFQLVGLPKSFVMLPLLSGKEIIGGISIADYEKENAFTDIPIGMLETISSNIGSAIQNVRLFEETQRLLKETDQRATELQIINNIGQTLTEGLDLNSMIERVAERLHEVLKVVNIAITIINPNTGQVIAQNKIFHSTNPSFATDRFSLDKFQSLMRLSARGGNRSWVMNTNVEKSWRKYAGNVLESDSIPKSFVALPLMVGKNAIGGIIFADYEKENAFIDLPVRMLETIAYNMGTGIQNVLLFDETQHLLNETDQRATELQIINNIGQMLTEGLDLQSTLERVGERLREVLKVDSLGIIANDTQTGLAVAHSVYLKGKRIIPSRFSLGKNLFGMQFAARVGGKPLVVNSNVKKNWRRFIADVPEWAEIPKAFVIMPLLAGKELVGSITIADYEDKNAFRNLPINLLETIASNMGTAIQNVRLFDETQRLLKETEQRATELQIINNIGQTLTEGGDLENMIQRVGERIQEALDINNVAISIFDKENERVIAPYMVRNGEKIKLTQENYDLRRYKMLIRAWARAGGGSSFWVVNKDIDKFWRRGWLGSVAEEVPKSLVALPLLAGGEIIGGILLVDYEKENAFTDISVNLLETIASNMGTAVQNVRLFDETKRLFVEAEESRASAVQANKAKSTFLANMSHELRTPLNAIIGFTRIVKRKAEGALPEKQIENLDKVLISSEHLLGLINTVLDIAKIEAGRMDVIPSKFSVNALADQCVTLASPLLKSDVNLQKQADKTIGFIFSDQDKIKQIVLNLLSNAAKFTHEGRILLSVEKTDDETIDISVSDSGIGISEEALGRIFEEFQQADTSTTREYGGTGLGLAISRNLALLLGGDLTATSELGKGSTFTLTVPVQYGKKSAAPDTKPESAQSAESQSDVAILANGKDERASLKTILIVEDTEFNIDVLAQLLNNEYNLLIAKDGGQGVSMAQENNPDLILMDISLPIMDGYEATRKIRETMKSTPIIGLSAHAMSGDAEKAKEAGCDDYLTKPIDEAILFEKINQYVR